MRFLTFTLMRMGRLHPAHAMLIVYLTIRAAQIAAIALAIWFFVLVLG